MRLQPLASRVQVFPEGLLVVAFSGKAGFGSEGNEQGQQMNDVVRHALDEHAASHVVLDMRGVDYSWGDWIGSPVLIARKRLGARRVCVVATGETERSLASLWALGLDRLVPLRSDIQEACVHLGVSPIPEPEDR